MVLNLLEYISNQEQVLPILDIQYSGFSTSLVALYPQKLHWSSSICLLHHQQYIFFLFLLIFVKMKMFLQAVLLKLFVVILPIFVELVKKWFLHSYLENSISYTLDPRRQQYELIL